MALQPHELKDLAQIIRLPVVRKRGRKSTKGPKASVSVIYEAPAPLRAMPTSQEERIERFAELLARKAARRKLELAEYEEWIAAHKEIVVFPEGRRYRSLMAIERLKAGKSEFEGEEEAEEQSDLYRAMDEFTNKAVARSKEILASQGADEQV